MGDGGRRRRWEAGTEKCAGNGGSESDEEIRRMRGTRRRKTKLVCVQGDAGRKRRMEAETGGWANIRRE